MVLDVGGDEHEITEREAQLRGHVSLDPGWLVHALSLPERRGSTRIDPGSGSALEAPPLRNARARESVVTRANLVREQRALPSVDDNACLWDLSGCASQRICHDGGVEVDYDRPLRVKVYNRTSPDGDAGPLIGQIQLEGDFRLEHLEWALLGDEDDEYLPYHDIERREWIRSFGAGGTGVDIIIEVMSNPYVQGVVGGLVTEGALKTTQWVMAHIRSAAITEDQAIHHARQWVAMSGGTNANDLTVVGSGVHPKGARWVDLESEHVRYRVGVALTSRGGFSVGTESWERI
jgi:hypothetical protein